jgi:hypothetical protein
VAAVLVTHLLWLRQPVELQNGVPVAVEAEAELILVMLSKLVLQVELLVLLPAVLPAAEQSVE